MKNSDHKGNASPVGTTGITADYKPEPRIYVDGNPDAQILAKAFVEYSKNGLVQSDRAIIERLDDLLKNADIVISPDGNTAAIAQNNGQTFTLNTPKPGKAR